MNVLCNPVSALIRRLPFFIQRSKDDVACQTNRIPSYLLDVRFPDHFQHLMAAVLRRDVLALKSFR